MNTTDVAILLSLARTQSFTATANQTYVTKQFVTKTIQNMEQDFGFPLLFRDHNTVSLTDAGQQLVDFLKRCDSKYCSTHISNRLFTHRPYIWVAVEDWIGLSYRLNRALNRYETENQCIIRVTQVGDGTAIGLLKFGEVDAVITSRYCTNSLEQFCRVRELEELGLSLHIAARHHLATQESEIILQSLPYLDTLVGEHSLDEATVRIKRLLSGVSCEPKQIHIKKNLSSVITEVLLGNGVTVQPEKEPLSDILAIPLRRSVTSVFVTLKKTHSPTVDHLGLALECALGGKSNDR